MPAFKRTPGAKLSNRGGAKDRLVANRRAAKRGGGRNSKGSRKKFRAGKKKTVAKNEKRPKPKWAPKNGYYWRRATSGRWYQKKIDFDPNTKQGFQNPGSGMEWKQENGLWKRKKIRKVDYRDGQYIREAGRDAEAYEGALAEAELARGALPEQLEKAQERRQIAYDRERYDTGASLAARGALRSGGYQNAALARGRADEDARLGIDDEYGRGAQRRITKQIADIGRNYRYQQEQRHSSARGRYAQRNPGSKYIFDNIK